MIDAMLTIDKNKACMPKTEYMGLPWIMGISHMSPG